MSAGEKYDRGFGADRREIEESLRYTGAGWNIDNSLRHFPKNQLSQTDLNSKQEIPEPPLYIPSD
jgi:hypothetical protein